jgi:small-conductance mechanosensitive channel
MKTRSIILLIMLGIALSLHGNTNDTLAVQQGDTLQLRIDSTALTTVVVADTIPLPEEQQQRNSLLNEVTGNAPAKPREVLESISFSKIFWTVVILIITYYFIRIIISLLTIISEKSVRLRITIKSLIPVIRIVIWIIIIAAIIKGIFDPPIETIIAVGASVGIAVGFAAQDLLKNFFGGIALLLDKPFQVGDKIDTGKHYGEVIEIGLRATRIVTPDDSVVSVPNAELINSSVSNSNSGQLDCQVVAEIFLPTTIHTEKVRKIATEAAQASRFIYLNKPIVVLFFNEINENKSYLKMRIKAYVMDIRYEFQFKSDMTEIVIRELINEGIIQGDELG